MAVMKNVQRPLCVDLDGTLIAGDLLWESLLELVRSRPLDVPLIFLWVAGGRGRLKSEIASRITLDVSSLPYRPEVLSFLKAEHGSGRTLVLATASDERLASLVAKHLGFFDEVLASDGARNLKGRHKLEALTKRFGSGGFDYVGDSAADLPIWEEAGHAIVVGSRPRLNNAAQAVAKSCSVIQTPGGQLKAILAAMRPHQWVKNVLVFVPIITSHQFSSLSFLMATLAFVAFCLAASSVYVLNDLLDLVADRAHPKKRKRPLASGRISIPAGLALFALLGTAAFGLSMIWLPNLFTLMLLLYMLITTAYSFYLKRKLIVDVLSLAELYTHRVLAGAVAASITVSTWLMAFSMCLFLSLAFAKRYVELSRTKEWNYETARRGYVKDDLDLIRGIGASLGSLCVLVFCLYLTSQDVLKLYRHPAMLWLVCPLLFYWIMRIWFAAVRDELNDDPVVYALKDRNSLIAVGASILVVLLAS